VSSRYDDHDVLPEEDDWFAEPAPAPWDPPSVEEQEWPGEYEPTPPPPRSPRTDSRRVGLIVAVATVAIGVFALGVLVVRAVGGGSSEGTPTVVTTAPTVPDTTLPDATTPATTPTDTTPTGTTTTPSSPTLPEGVTLRPGDSGDNVVALQEALSQAGYDPGAVDGDYGPSTSQAVSAFQTAEGLSIDGVAGPETLAALAAASSSG
jgi:Putative peptidoglycan binding domain